MSQSGCIGDPGKQCAQVTQASLGRGSERGGGVYDRSADIDLEADQESVRPLEWGRQGRRWILLVGTLLTAGACPGQGEGEAKGDNPLAE